MSLTLHYHPLSSFSMKVLIALYENQTPFAANVIDFFDAASAGAFRKLWPIAKIPVLEDSARDRTVPETSIIIEYLDQHYPGPSKLIPADPDLARQTRFRDRFFDLYLNVPMQKIVTDRLRPEGKGDAFGVEDARRLLATALDLVEAEIGDEGWAMGTAFTMADCAAAPALFYADKVMPLAERHPKAARYLARLAARPSFARVLAEAEPYFKLFPQ
ncbi:MAG: glutathione S-transferase family protein [Rhodospirillaceae bacterium]|nr:glutathione S-transferase family protein [Rhodospirillaceae bacterium]